MATSRSWGRSANCGIGLHKIEAMEPLCCAQGTTNINPNIFRTLQRSDTPMQRHSMHHTEANKLTNSLLKDIAIFNEHDSAKLEDWLMDLETAADLTNESQA